MLATVVRPMSIFGPALRHESRAHWSPILRSPSALIVARVVPGGRVSFSLFGALDTSAEAQCVTAEIEELKVAAGAGTARIRVQR
jgi:hypothetical protein